MGVGGEIKEGREVNKEREKEGNEKKIAVPH